jgi:hypothetical protein
VNFTLQLEHNTTPEPLGMEPEFKEQKATTAAAAGAMLTMVAVGDGYWAHEVPRAAAVHASEHLARFVPQSVARDDTQAAGPSAGRAFVGSDWLGSVPHTTKYDMRVCGPLRDCKIID